MGIRRMTTKPQAADWGATQDACADVPGAAGIALRRERYAPFFLRFGRDVVIEEGCRFYHPDRIVIDDDARINIGALIYGSGGLWIGRHARIGPRFFAHSANHDVGEGPTAFFERGYIYVPTVIGDNVLISANVSIMPGATLGNGAFVGAGAVVTAGEYGHGARLFGIPATDKSSPARPGCEAAPEIALLVPESEHWRDAVVHLLSALGLPQVVAAAEREQLPASVHTVVVCGPDGWNPAVPDGADAWALKGGAETSKPGEAWFPASSGGRITLPERVGLTVVSDGRDNEDAAIGALEQTLFWLDTRLTKGAGPIPLQEEREWQAAICILGLEPGRRDRLRERIGEAIEKRRRGALRNRLSKLSKASVGHAELVLAAIDARADARRQLRERAAATASQAKTAVALVACGVAAELLGDTETGELVRSRLATPEWRVPGVAMPRSAPGGKGFCYSPLVLAWLFLEARRKDPGFALPEGIASPNRLITPLAWEQIGSGGALFDEASRTISRSLLDNWLKLHAAPCPAGSQVLLEDANYGQETAPLEQAWREMFRLLQGRKGRPLIRIRPWPAGATAAVSVRYDVDRPVSAATVKDIVDRQIRFANAACGSWYYFQGRPPSEGQERQLAQHWQEVAIHVEHPDSEPVAGLGATHHSAPTSAYWRGDGTNRLLDERGAVYCEFLGVQTAVPRPAWIGGPGGEGRLGSVWTTPIHFPLEGSTSDTDLSYFDARRKQFERLAASGGHCIIGTHPDLNQELFDQLLRRGGLHGAWFAPVGKVVERCRQLLSYGAVSCVRHPDGHIALLSRDTVADVRVEVWEPDSGVVQALTLQLAAGQPRPLPQPGN